CPIRLHDRRTGEAIPGRGLRGLRWPSVHPTGQTLYQRATAARLSGRSPRPDAKLGVAFAAAFEGAGARVVRTAVRTPAGLACFASEVSTCSATARPPTWPRIRLRLRGHSLRPATIENFNAPGRGVISTRSNPPRRSDFRATIARVG